MMTLLVWFILHQNEIRRLSAWPKYNISKFEANKGAATAGNDFRPPVSSQPVLVLNANYISRFLTYLTSPKT